jgi:hypothetical protein
MAVRIGELLLKEKRITPAQLQEALNYQKTNGGKLGFNLVKLGFVKTRRSPLSSASSTGCPRSTSRSSRSTRRHQADPAETAQNIRSFPLSRSGATLTIAMIDPTNVFAMDDIKFMTGYNVEPVVARKSAVADAIARTTRRMRRPPKTKREEDREEGGAAVRRRNLNSAATLEMVTKALEETAAVVDDDVDVLEGARADRRLRRWRSRAAKAPVIRSVEPDADVGDPEGRERHPHRAVREGVPGAGSASTASSTTSWRRP